MFLHLSLNIFCYMKINKMQEKYFVLLCNVLSIVSIFFRSIFRTPCCVCLYRSLYSCQQCQAINLHTVYCFLFIIYASIRSYNSLQCNSVLPVISISGSFVSGNNRDQGQSGHNNKNSFQKTYTLNLISVPLMNKT